MEAVAAAQAVATEARAEAKALAAEVAQLEPALRATRQALSTAGVDDPAAGLRPLSAQGQLGCPTCQVRFCVLSTLFLRKPSAQRYNLKPPSHAEPDR